MTPALTLEPVMENGPGSRTSSGAHSAVSGAGVGDVELAEDLRKHLGEVVVVVDVGQERLIVLLEPGEVDTVVIGVVELALFLLEDVFEHVGPLGCAVKLHAHVEVDGLYLFSGEGHDLGTGTEDVELLAVLVQMQCTGGDALAHL